MQTARTADLAIGSHWSVRGSDGFKPNVYELVEIDPKGDESYPYVLRLISRDARAGARFTLGYEIRVERNWFVVRGRMASAVEGAVRRVA